MISLKDIGFFRSSCFGDLLFNPNRPAFCGFGCGVGLGFIAKIPYKKKDFVSHRVSSKVYEGLSRMNVFSKKLCQIMIKMNNWNPDSSYRVSETELGNHEAVIFDLKQAEIIKRI